MNTWAISSNPNSRQIEAPRRRDFQSLELVALDQTDERAEIEQVLIFGIDGPRLRSQHSDIEAFAVGAGELILSSAGGSDHGWFSKSA